MHTAKTYPLYLLAVVLVLAAGIWVYRAHTNATPPYLHDGRVSYTESAAYWQNNIQKAGASEAQAEFLAAGKALPARESHLLAHSFGEALYAALGVKGFSFCTTDFNYGCYHQFIGSAIVHEGLSIAEGLNTACESLAQPKADGCKHGIGHGVLGYLGYTPEALQKALAVCDTLPQDPHYSPPYKPCVEGSFMEYNQRQLASLDSATSTPRPLSEGYTTLCETVAAPYAHACAFWLPGWWATVLQPAADAAGFAPLGAHCTELDAALQKDCFGGLGYTAEVAANLDTKKAFAICDAVLPNPDAKVYCRAGVTRRVDGGKLDAGLF